MTIIVVNRDKLCAQCVCRDGAVGVRGSPVDRVLRAAEGVEGLAGEAPLSLPLLRLPGKQHCISQ